MRESRAGVRYDKFFRESPSASDTSHNAGDKQYVVVIHRVNDNVIDHLERRQSARQRCGSEKRNAESLRLLAVS